jgi:hypothetical protein
MANNFFKIDKGTTLTPQTAEPAGQNGDSYYNSTLGKFRFYENGSWKSLGSGSGSSGPNYIVNPDGEADTTGWATYLDSDSVTFTDAGDLVTLNSHGLDNGQSISFTSITSTTGISVNTRYYVISVTTNTFQVATTFGGSAIALTTNGSGTMVRDRPVNMTAGSASTTWTTSNSAPLRGISSFLLTKSANNRMGEGVSYDFTIDAADQAKAFTIAFDYAISSGTYADGDVTIWIYDVTNGVLIQPTASSLLNIGGVYGGRKSASFQTNSNSTSYRVGLHISSVSAVAYTLKTDSFSVSPNTYNEGAATTEWTSVYAPSTNITNATRSRYFTRRSGDTLEVSAAWTFTGAGALTSIPIAAILPAGMLPDMNKIGYDTYGSGYTTIGSYDAHDIGVADYYGVVTLATLGTTINCSTASGAAPFTPGNTDVFSITIKLPIVGFGTSQVLSSDTDTRVVAARYVAASNQTTSSTAPMNYLTLDYDTHSAVTTGSAWKFTAPVPGFYNVSVHGYWNTGTTTRSWVYKNGVIANQLGDASNSWNQMSMGSTVIQLKAGDYIDIRPDVSFGSGLAQGQIVIHRLSGAAQVAASESVTCRYTSPTQSITASLLVVKYLTKDFDSHSAYNTSTGLFTAPMSGKYMLKATLNATTNIAAGGINQAIYLSVHKNNVASSTIGYFTHQTTTSVFPYVQGSMILNLVAGDTVEIRSTQNTGASWTSSGDFNSYFEINRIGN